MTESFCHPPFISAISQMSSLSDINLCLVGLEISYQQGHLGVTLFERHLAPVVCRINCIGWSTFYPLDSDLSTGWSYPLIQQFGQRCEKKILN